MNFGRGFVPQLCSTRYSRAFIRIPNALTWSDAGGVPPEYCQ